MTTERFSSGLWTVSLLPHLRMQGAFRACAASLLEPEGTTLDKNDDTEADEDQREQHVLPPL